jgi:predicted nucleic acid-binding protein
LIVVSNSSPLITLGRSGYLDLLPKLFGRIHVATEVFIEVTVLGAGRPGSQAVRGANWIEVHPAINPSLLDSTCRQHSLGKGEVATVLLSRSLPADFAVIDERSARKFARTQGVTVMGCLGIIETAFRRGLVPDLRVAYQDLLNANIRIDQGLLSASLASFGLPPL